MEGEQLRIDRYFALQDQPHGDDAPATVDRVRLLLEQERKNAK